MYGTLDKSIIVRYLEDQIDKIKRQEEITRGAVWKDYFLGMRTAYEDALNKICAGKFEH